MVRRVKPQIAQVAIPVVGSRASRLAQPLVWQNSGFGLAMAEDDRRRSRRIEVARPATDVVAERDNMGTGALSGAP